jgi:integrase
MASVKVVTKNKIYSDGTIPVLIRVISGRSTSFAQICKVEPKYFDAKKQRIRPTHPRAVELNQLISERRAVIEAGLLDNQRRGITSDTKQILRPTEARTGLIEYIEDMLLRMKQRGKVHTANKSTGHIYALKKFLGNRPMTFELFTEDVIHEFHAFCRNELKHKKNTIHCRMDFIKSAFTDAGRRGVTKADPFRFLSFEKEKPRKEKLTADDLERLEGLTLTGRRELARDTFMLQYYLHGMRISDVLMLKPENIKDGRIEYTMLKTNANHSIRISGKAKKIIDKYLPAKYEEVSYLLPWMKAQYNSSLSSDENIETIYKQIESKVFMVNQTLAKIQKEYGFGVKIRTHIARHSFASQAALKTNGNIRAVSQALGHSSLNMTQIYLRDLESSELDRVMSAVYED